VTERGVESPFSKMHLSLKKKKKNQKDKREKVNKLGIREVNNRNCTGINWVVIPRFFSKVEKKRKGRAGREDGRTAGRRVYIQAYILEKGKRRREEQQQTPMKDPLSSQPEKALRGRARRRKVSKVS